MSSPPPYQCWAIADDWRPDCVILGANVNTIPTPPPLSEVTIGTDGLWGAHEWTVYPQQYHSEFPYLAWIPLSSSTSATSSDILMRSVNKSMWQAHPNTPNTHVINPALLDELTARLETLKASLEDPLNNSSSYSPVQYPKQAYARAQETLDRLKKNFEPWRDFVEVFRNLQRSLLELHAFLDWWADMKAGDNFKSSVHGPTRGVIFEDVQPYLNFASWSIAAFLLVHRSTFVLDPMKRIPLSPREVCKAQPMSSHPLQHTLPHWYYPPLVNNIVTDLETVSRGYGDRLDPFNPTKALKRKLDIMENKRNNEAICNVKKAKKATTSQITQLGNQELKSVVGDGVPAPDWYPKILEVWMNATSQVDISNLPQRPLRHFSLPPIRLFLNADKHNQSVYYYHFFVLHCAIRCRTTGPNNNNPPMLTIKEWKSILGESYWKSQWPLAAPDANNLSLTFNPEMFWKHGGPLLFGDTENTAIANGDYNPTSPLPCGCPVQMDTANDPLIKQAALYHLNWLHAIEEIKEMEQHQFPTKQWSSDQTNMVQKMVTIWDPKSGASEPDTVFFHDKKIWRDWLQSFYTVVKDWDGFNGWDWGQFNLGYDPNQPIPGSFTNPTNLSPYSSDLSDPPLSPSSVQTEPESKQEVDLILSHHSAQSTAPRGTTTRSRAQVQAQAQQSASATADIEASSQSVTFPQLPDLPAAGLDPLNQQPIALPQPPPNISQQGHTVPAGTQAPQQVNRPTLQPLGTTTSQPPNINQPNPPAPAAHRRMTLANLPGVNEWLAPSFSEERPEEAGWYFARVKELLARHTVTTNQDKKLGTLKYLSLRSERLWMGVPAWADQTKTYDEFKAGVLRLYPQASDDATFTIHDLDATVGEQARLGILNSNDLGDYYQDFLVISQYLVSKNRLSAAEQSRAFICGFQPTLEQHIKQRLQLKKPDHNPQDTYELNDIYDAAAFVLMATASTSTDVKLEAILTMLERAFSGDSQQTGNRPRNTAPRSTDSTSVCNFCGVPGHFIRECEIVAEYGRLGKCKCNHEGKVVLPSGAMVPHEITGAWLRDRFDEYHAWNPGQLGATQMFFEMTAQIDKSKAARFTDDCPEDDEPGVYALRRQYVPRNRMPSRSLPMRGGVLAGPSESTTKSASMPHRDQLPHLSQPTTQGVSVTADDAEDVHPYAGAPDAVDNSDTTVGTTKPVPRPPFQQRSDQAYSTTAKIYDEGVARTVYDQVMDALITVSQRELLSLAPELRTQVADATIQRRISCDFTQAMIKEIPEVEQKPDRTRTKTRIRILVFFNYHFLTRPLYKGSPLMNYPLDATCHQVFLYHNERIAKPFHQIYVVDHESWDELRVVRYPPIYLPLGEDLHGYLGPEDRLFPHPVDIHTTSANRNYYLPRGSAHQLA
ncbi:hypothetical protein EDB85DRAFT_2162357 [Lactarius pseudohatsudake]|nr:hypothetical protein EDB85DRAFT_2162357 [Lactarius pseudohatsudake]